MRWYKQKKWLLGLGIIILVVIFFVWRITHQTTSFSESSTVKRADIKSTLVLSGNVDADQHAVLHFPTSGLVSWVGVKEGDIVKKNQALASLDKRSLKKTLEQKLNNFMTYRWNFEQTQEDNKNWQTRGMTDQERDAIERLVDKSQFNLNNSVLDVELQDIAVQLATITSPIPGIVVKADPIFSGVNVTPVSATYEIVNPETLYFTVSADQSEVINLKYGQAVTITLDSFADHQLQGTVDWISYTPDSSQSGTVYNLKVTAPELKTNRSIRMGMTGDAEFVTGEAQSILIIPNNYLLQDGQGPYVWVDKATRKQYIKTGIESIDAVEILEGLTEGQSIFLKK